MNCPGCTAQMAAEIYSGNYGTQVEIDVCHTCNGIWFDGRESLSLTPGSTLQLFRSMHERRAQARQGLQETKPCPRCDGPLRETFDQQRNTRFNYFRCEEHGRFVTFFMFLREKNIVREMDPKQVNELKSRVKIVSCSNCGAPIDLALHSACPYCRAPLAFLAPESLESTLQSLQKAEQKRTTVDPQAAANLIIAQLKAKSFYDQLDREDALRGTGRGRGHDLVEVGFDLLFGTIGALMR